MSPACSPALKICNASLDNGNFAYLKAFEIDTPCPHKVEALSSFFLTVGEAINLDILLKLVLGSMPELVCQ